MPLVFVHGVATRQSTGYDDGVLARDALFRRFLLTAFDSTTSIRNPYWGEFGGSLRRGDASFRGSDLEHLGAADLDLDLAASVFAAPKDPATPEDPDRRLLAAARVSLAAAVDLLWEATTGAADQEEAEALAALAAEAASYAVLHEAVSPAWLAEVDDDGAFLDRLRTELEALPRAVPGERPDEVDPNEWEGGSGDGDGEWESLGIGAAWNALRHGLDRIKRTVTAAVGGTAVDALRGAVVPQLAAFLGDVFVYLSQQDEPGSKIRDVVLSALREAAAEATAADPLIVVAHSMGGNIVYDLLSDPATGAGLDVELLVTAGTQVGLFEDLGLFVSSPRAAVAGVWPPRMRPANVARWVNVLDPSDPLGFRLGGIVEGVQEWDFHGGEVLKAHSAYFRQPLFHERLLARVRE